MTEAHTFLVMEIQFKCYVLEFINNVNTVILTGHVQCLFVAPLDVHRIEIQLQKVSRCIILQYYRSLQYTQDAE